MEPWIRNRVCCRFCDDIVVAEIRRTVRCSCGKTRVKSHDCGNAAGVHEASAYPEWDLWDEGGDIVVAPAHAVDGVIRRAERNGRPFSGVLAVWTDRRREDEEKPTYCGLTPEVVGCSDAESERWPSSPMTAHIESILTFGRTHGSRRVLIHCSQGVGRSPSAALAILADRLGGGKELDALEEVLRLRPCAIINFRMTGLADEALGRDGVLLSTVKRHPLIRARHSARARDYGWQQFPTLLMPHGGSEDLSRWS